MPCPVPRPVAQAPGAINHVVFFDLKDQAEADELVQDCFRLFVIEGVSSGYVGKHYDIGRESVLRDYDVGFFVAFQTEADYHNYLTHPLHVELVESWKPRWESIRIYDVGDVRTMGLSDDQ